MNYARAPGSGEIWSFRYRLQSGRGRVLIDNTAGLVVEFTYLGSGAAGEATLPAFLSNYVHTADSASDLSAEPAASLESLDHPARTTTP